MNKVFSSYGSQSQETNVLRLMYRKEAMQRKLLYNKVGNKLHMCACVCTSVYVWLCVCMVVCVCGGCGCVGVWVCGCVFPFKSFFYINDPFETADPKLYEDHGNVLLPSYEKHFICELSEYI